MARSRGVFWTGWWAVIAFVAACCVTANGEPVDSRHVVNRSAAARGAAYYRSKARINTGDYRHGLASKRATSPGPPLQYTRRGGPYLRHRFSRRDSTWTVFYPPYGHNYRMWHRYDSGRAYGYAKPYRTWRSDDYQRQRVIEQDQERDRRWQERVSRLRQSHVRLMTQGLDAFRAGDYRGAATSFMAATKADQGNVGSRLHAAHALFAIGEYRSATIMVRRAFELQPRLTALPFDIRDDYGKATDFEAHLAALVAEAHRVERDEGLWVLLGYVRAYSGDSPGAYRAARRAQRLNPRDTLAGVLAGAHRTAELAREDLKERRTRTATQSPRTKAGNSTKATVEPADDSSP